MKQSKIVFDGVIVPKSKIVFDGVIVPPVRR
jgi:hypothetical protein